MKKNIFSTLSKYTSSQEENFLTEALVYVLNTLIENEESEGKKVLQKLCGENTKNWFDDTDQISVSTQLSTDEGRPDIVILIGDRAVIYIEVKHDSRIGHQQMERYYRQLEKSLAANKQLVLLTRSKHSIQETSLEADKFHHVCWYEISGWLSEMVSGHEISNYLAIQLIDFLKEKDMSMEKIKWEYMEGVPALVNLMNMLGTAIAEALPEESPRKSPGWTWSGYYFGEITGLWIGIRYNDPLTLVIENNNGKKPTFGKYYSLSGTHFFSLSAGEQLESLISFIKEAHDEYSQKG